MSRADHRLHGRGIGLRGSGKAQRTMTVQQALEWAFRVEKARLDLPERPGRDRGDDVGTGFGMEYILLQRAELGCRVDGGRHKMGSYTHPDAEVIAATEAGMPDELVSLRMAIRVAELARAGLTPDWMPGAIPRCVPVSTRENQYGVRAVTEIVGTERELYRGTWRTVDVLACPVTWRPHPEQIDAARRDYDAWWRALGWVRDGLVGCGVLREITVTTVMPKVRPWEQR
jgi:hypothetical protein